ncbi:hypothetical protein [Phyllobacterium sp. P5_D12]
MVLLVKSRQPKKPAAEEGDELSTEEKLKAALEDRVKDAVTEKDRAIAERDLAEYTKLVRK